MAICALQHCLGRFCGLRWQVDALHTKLPQHSVPEHVV
jgi:hypothetical protein